MALIEESTAPVFDALEDAFLPAWRHTLLVDWPMPRPQVRANAASVATSLRISRPGQSGEILGTYWAPSTADKGRSPGLVVLADADGTPPANQATPPSGIASLLSQRGFGVLQVNQYSTGVPADQFAKFYSTYNRTLMQERVRDLLTICAAVPDITSGGAKPSRVVLAGSGRAGLWALAAAPRSSSTCAAVVSLGAGCSGLFAPTANAPDS